MLKKNLWQTIRQWLTVNKYSGDPTFSMSPSRPASRSDTAQAPAEGADSKQQDEPADPKQSSSGAPKRFRPSAKKNNRRKRLASIGKQVKLPTVSIRPVLEQPQSPKSEPAPATEGVTSDLQENLKKLRDTFNIPPNADIVIREFNIGTIPPTPASIIMTDGITDKNIVHEFILQPLIHFTQWEKLSDDLLEEIQRQVLTTNQVTRLKKYQDVINAILEGSTVLLVEGLETAISIETKGWEHRSVGLPQTEHVVKGPQDAFAENLRTNTALIRTRIRTKELITEIFKVGKQSHTDVAMMYLSNVANTKLINEVKRRIDALDVPFLLDSGMLEQFIEDQPFDILPNILSTERPDRASSYILEGHVVLIVAGSPRVLIAPATFWAFLQTSEEAFLRWPVGTFLRLMRIVGIFAVLFLPAFYIALVNYHPEMLPTSLMLAIASSREHIPFPVILEVILMEISLELIREAGLRIPSSIGNTIGIVGALILGQAAVQAGLVSPMLVIVVAITALGSFAIPNYEMGFGLRMLRFFFVALGAIFGFVGITIGFVMVTALLSHRQSFGVPYLSPVTPYRKSNPDVVMRGPIFQQEQNPSYLHPRKARRQKEVVRTWDPNAPDPQGGNQP